VQPDRTNTPATARRKLLVKTALPRLLDLADFRFPTERKVSDAGWRPQVTNRTLRQKTFASVRLSNWRRLLCGGFSAHPGVARQARENRRFSLDESARAQIHAHFPQP
jgi:hypothetical protein